MRGLAVIVLFSSTVARAGELAEDGNAFCSFAGAVARSESALALSPQLFVDYGVVNGNDVLTAGTTSISTLPPSQRLTVGLRYSLVGLFQGVTTRKRASADCERYRAASALARFLVENREQVSPASLDAKLTVLHAASGKAREIVAATHTALERGRATVEEAEAADLRAAELAALTSEAEGLRAGLPSRTALEPPETLLEHALEAEARVERYDAQLRQSRAFDVSLRGGYDQVFGQRDVLPLFAVVSMTLNPAAIYQPVPEAEALRARVRWVHAETEGVAQKVELLAGRLRATLAGERRRLRETAVLLADVEGRLRALETIESERIRRVRDATWFDWVRLKADQEFLRVHVAELEQSLGLGPSGAAGGAARSASSDGGR